MKTLLLLCLTFTLTLFLAHAQPPDTPATPGTTFGTPLSAGKPVAAENLPAILRDGKVHDLKITGKVVDVCPKKGCWFTLRMPHSLTAFVRMKDYGFFVPVALKGKTVTLEATAERVITPIADLKHYAADAGKTREEIDAITSDKEEIRLTATGIQVVR